jgi:hypothetical protein
MYNHAASAREPDGQEHTPVDQHAVGRRLLPAAAAAPPPPPPHADYGGGAA